MNVHDHSVVETALWRTVCVQWYGRASVRAVPVAAKNRNSSLRVTTVTNINSHITMDSGESRERVTSAGPRNGDAAAAEQAEASQGRSATSLFERGWSTSNLSSDEVSFRISEGANRPHPFSNNHPHVHLSIMLAGNASVGVSNVSRFRES
jgi:hypothetical protein